MKNKELIDVFLLIGQSNAVGKGEVEKAIVKTSNAFEYISTGHMIPMRNFLETSMGNGTIAQAFSNTWATLTNNKICFIQSAVDGSMIKNWIDDRYTFLDDALRKFKNRILKINKNYDINKIYAIWIQGESDGKYGTEPIYYKEKLIKLGKILENAGVHKTFVSITGYWNGANPLRLELISSVQEVACNEDENLCLCSKKALGFMKRKLLIDEVHYSQEALNELGEDMAKNIYYYYLTNTQKELDDQVDLSKAKYILNKLMEIMK